MYKELDRELILDLIHNKPGWIRRISMDNKTLLFDNYDYLIAATEIKFYNIKAQVVKNDLLRIKTSLLGHNRHVILINTYSNINLNDFPDQAMESFLAESLKAPGLPAKKFGYNG